MEFKVNNATWKIFKKSAKEVLDDLNEGRTEKFPYAFGLTRYPSHEIWINGEMCLDQQCTTLAHELTHCWIWCHGMYYVTSVEEELVCDLVSTCYGFIHEIVERYKKEMK